MHSVLDRGFVFPALPISESVGDVRFEDPFRRLEDDSPQVAAWEAALDAEARQALRSLPEYETVAKAVAPHVAACLDAPPIRGGERWFGLQMDAECRHQAIWSADAFSAPRRNVVLATDLDAGPNAGFDWLVPSPDGVWLAVGVSSRGDEQSALHLVDARTGEPARPRIPHVSDAAVAWQADGGGLFCLAGRATEHRSLVRDLLRIAPGAPPDQVPLPNGVADRRLALQMSPEGRFLGLVANPIAPRLCGVLDRAADTWLNVASVPDDEIFSGLFFGDRYFAVTSVGAPRGRLIAVDIERLDDPDAWDEIVGEGKAVLRAVAPAGPNLLLCLFVDGASRLRVVSPDGTVIRDIPLPSSGVVTTSPRAPEQYGATAPVNTDAAGFTFSFSALDRSPVVLRHEFASATTDMTGQVAITLEHIRAEQGRCASADGAIVRYDVVSDVGVNLCEPRPTLVVAYGGWNAMSPARAYLAHFTPFVEAGGNVVFVHARGDATYGSDQWHGARRSCKQRTFDDVYAVAEDLVSRRLSDRDRLGLWGASNGGIIVGAALTQRPDLFKVVVALVPLFDMARFVLEPFGEHFTWEYGDPRSPEEAVWLRGYSPYHNVRDGVHYPATLIVCGADDVRVHPWHARKMIARLKGAQAGCEPLLLRVHQGFGHVTVTDRSPPWMIAEWLAFAMHRLGLAIPKSVDDTSARPAVLPELFDRVCAGREALDDPTT